MEQNGLVGCGLVFAACEHECRHGLDGFVGGEQFRLRFGLRAFFGLGIDGKHGKQVGLDCGKGSEREFRFHDPILSSHGRRRPLRRGNDDHARRTKEVTTPEKVASRENLTGGRLNVSIIEGVIHGNQCQAEDPC
jgi:hypothetical protein